MAERCANWAGEIAIAAFCWVWGVFATMARKLSIVRGTAIAIWAAFATRLTLVVGVGVEGGLLGGGPPWGSAAPFGGV